MSAIGGPDIVEDGLVLTLDAANIKSFKGEPTTNIIANPQFTSYTNSTAGDSSIIKVNFGEGRVGIQMVQTSTANIVSFSLSLSNNTPTSGATYTLSAEVFGNKTGALVKSQVSVFVNGVRHWLTDSNNWTTTVTENSLFFRPTQLNSWHKTATTFTFPLGTLTNFSFSGFYRNTGDFILRVANIQLEAKPYATTFVNGIRGTTVATGGGWVDRSGNSNHGELVNGPTYDDDNLGSLVFDGVDDYIQIPYSTYWNTNVFGAATNFTLECWYKPDLFKNWDTLIEKSESPGWYSRPEGASIWTNSTSIQGVFSSGVDSNPAGSFVIITYTTSELRWYHICFTGDGTTLRLYVDGVQRGGNASVSSRTVEVYNGNIGPRLGRRAYMDGKMASVRLYTRGLTESEVLQNYNATKGRYGL